MEGILRSEEMAEIEKLYKEAFCVEILDSFHASLVYFPVRHHSPACAFHLKNVIKTYEPDIILIEGPTNANGLIEFLIHEETKPPFAVYYSYRDKNGYISEDKKDYKCYYPFLDYSPEIVALKEGNRIGAKTRFIDLPYSEILIYSKEGKGLLEQKEKHNYNDDYWLSRNQFIQQICERCGMRNFDELWEKFFEINGRDITPDEFVKNMLAYCYLSRINTPQEELVEEACLIREQYMAEQILKELEDTKILKQKETEEKITKRLKEEILYETYDKKSDKKILVVTGGFHTYGIIECMKKMNASKGYLEFDSHRENHSLKEGESALSLKKVKLHGEHLKNQKSAEAAYLMPYSMEASDQLNGYASGMPYPEFYQMVWEAFKEGVKLPYEDSVLRAMLMIGKSVRKKEGYLSTYDEICAYHMSNGLAALRGKKEPGVYELYDSILAAYVKGDLNASTDSPLRIFREKMTGKRIGILCKEANVPPLVMNFEACCKEYGLKIHTTLEQEVVLEIFSSSKHRKISTLFARLLFLEATFCRKRKGPSLAAKKNRNLIREVWNYKWNTSVIGELIDKSVYGATIEEASGAFLKEQLKDNYVNAEKAARLLTEAFEMGLSDIFIEVMEKLGITLAEDSSFFSLAACLEDLNIIYELRDLYEMTVEEELKSMIEICFEKTVTLLPSMANIKAEDCEKMMKSCKVLYELSMDRNKNMERVLWKERLKEAFFTMLEKSEIYPKLEGAVFGLLYGLGDSSVEVIVSTCAGYMKGTHEKLLQTASFLSGLFYGARDVVFVSEKFLKNVDELMQRISEEEFMKMLPELRLAFSYFTPREIDKIAQRAASFYGVKKEKLRETKGVLPEMYRLGRELDAYAVSVLSV